MSIDAQSESLVSLHDAAKLLPPRRGGKRPHVSCMYRWTSSGCRGVILESLQVGGTRCTSHEALARFFDRLTHADGGPLPIRSLAERRRASEKAAAELARYGIDAQGFSDPQQENPRGSGVPR